MQPGESPFNVEVILGDDKGLQQLFNYKIFSVSDPEEVKKTKQTAKLTEDNANSMAFTIHFSVYEGREKEAEEYLLDGLENRIPKPEMSPLQFVARKPDPEEATYTLRSEPGLLILTYHVLNEVIDEEVRLFFLDQLSKFNSITIMGQLRGYISHKKNNRTNVKIDFSRLQAIGHHLDTPTLVAIFKELSIGPEEFFSSQLLDFAARSKKLHLSLKFKSFRDINKYYEDVGKQNETEITKSEKEFGYINKGLFKGSVEAYGFYSDKFALKLNFKFNGEDVLIRLVKVYFKALKKLFNEC